MSQKKRSNRISALLGVVLGLALGGVDNDGRNALSLGRSPQALYAFWLQLNINAHVARGQRLKDMPEEWFTPPDTGHDNPLVAAIEVFRCNRLMDAHQLREAQGAMEALLDGDWNLIGVHQRLLRNDLLYCELLLDRRPLRLSWLRSKGQLKFMKSMKKFPSVLRTEYAWALLEDRDAAKAAEVRARFMKVGRSYPYRSDWEGELELMEMAEKSSSTIV